MRALALVLAAVTELTLVAAAAAAQIVGTTGNDVLVGTARSDVIAGLPGDDQIFGHGGDGPDRLYAVARDGQLDVLDCGPGIDVAVVREGEPVTLVGCERTITVSRASPVGEPGDPATSS